MNAMQTTGDSAASPSRAAFIFIFFTVLLDMLALGLVVPVLPRLVMSFVDNDAARTAEIYGLFSTVWALMQFFFSPVQGALSDRFGRRPVILGSNFGLGLDYILMALAPSLAWLFVGRTISGITAASFSTAFAYIADVTPPEKRSARFGMLGVAFGGGFVLGPALGGLLGSIDLRLPFWTAAGLSLANAAYGYFVVPESLPRERRSAFSWRRANPIGSLKLVSANRTLFGLATVHFLGNFAHALLPSVMVIYLTYRFGWNERDVGFIMAAIGVCAMVVQGVLIGPVTARLGERLTVIVGLAFGVVSFAVYGLASERWMFLVGLPLMSLWGLAGPSTLALMSRRIGPQQQGQLQGANSSIMGLANFIAPGIFTQVFAFAVGAGQAWHFPGAPFVLAALVLAIAGVVAALTTRDRLTPAG